MAYEHYTITIDSSAALTSAQDGTIIATLPGASSVSKFTTIIPSRRLLHVPDGKSLRVDNPSPLSLSFPDAGIYVGPFTSGFVGRANPPMAQMYCQCRWEGAVVTTPPDGWTVDIYVLPDDSVAASPGVQSVAEYPTLQQSVKGYFQTSPYDDQAGAFSPVGLHTVGGYDASMIDGLYLPARTPNVWINNEVTPVAGTPTIVLSYTSPAGQYWRLLWAAISVDIVGGGALSAGRYMALVSEGGTTIVNYIPMTLSGSYMASLQLQLPANGRKASTAGSTINIWVYADAVASGTVARANLGLYVGR